MKIVVPISGGKDSQACLKLALACYPAHEVRGLFNDTGWEHPWTYDHVSWLERTYGVQIDRTSAGDVEDQCYKHGRLPSGTARFCTEELKIWPSKRYYKQLAEAQGSRIASKKRGITASQEGGFEVWYGMREAESHERKKRYAGKVCSDVYEPHEVLDKYPQYLGKLGVRFRMAILEWTTAEVKGFVGEGELNPLYAAGFDRVGCFPCEAGGDGDRMKAYTFDEFGQKQMRRVIKIAADLGKPMFGTKKGKAFATACGLHCGMG